jgi:glycosyltransferase involved in cell wall biosynthesis
VNQVPSLSIVVPTFNCRTQMEPCLRSIHTSPGLDLETIIVDQESSDGTIDVARQFPVRILSRPRPRRYGPPSESRNLGAEAATAEFLLHLDCDMRVTPALLSEIVAKLRGGYGALIIHEHDLTGGYWSKCKALERRTYLDGPLEYARAVRKDVFWAVGGYDTRISSGEDVDIHERYRRATQVGYCSTHLTHDLRELTFTGSLKKKFSYGFSSLPYTRKHPRGAAGLVVRQVACYLQNVRALAAHPLLTAGMFALRGAEGLAALSGLSLAYFKSLRNDGASIGQSTGDRVLSQLHTSDKERRVPAHSNGDK